MQLAFQPAFDVFHTAFRFLRLRRLLDADREWHYDQLRIADYYLSFFFRLERVRLYQRHRWLKKLAANDDSKLRYEYQPGDAFLFERMKVIQQAAMGTLLSRDYFQPDAYERGFLKWGSAEVPPELQSRIDEANSQDEEVMKGLGVLLTEYELLGQDGLKHRTGLLEYRYDAV